ncbi:hypothetical protein GIB67_008086, partial [Kingdonia uniflora]
SSITELANQELTLEGHNIRVVRALYEALSARDVVTVHRLLASDIEWWFHGPPVHQHMMRLLTGASSISLSSEASFLFLPVSVTAIGPTVLVEGCNKERSISWVHAWTVTDGIVTQVREYFNTSLTVTRFETSSSNSCFHCLPLWQSKLSGDGPGLVLAI